MKQPKDYIIFPLDVPVETEAKRFVSMLSDDVGMFKVGLELFIRSGPDIVRFIRESENAGVFLDLKLHDIPATVFAAMEKIAELDVTFATVHCGESQRMLEAAVSGSHEKVGVLGVTILTSVNNEDIRAAGFKDEFTSNISALVIKRADMAKHAGCAGIVCSGLEAGMIRSRFGKDFVLVTPGIRPSWAPAKDDQRRITTPAHALANGADYLVIGRPIRDAANPKDAARRIAQEIESAINRFKI